MRWPHLFEFMDQARVFPGLRATLREILECGNAQPFRPYYQWVRDEVRREAHEGGFRDIVELGAGTAPVTRLLAAQPAAGEVRLIPCDMNPDFATYRRLEERHPGIVAPVYTPVDFSEPRRWGPDTLLFLSATFHHVPPEARPGVLASLTSSARRVMIFEPLQKRLSSIIFVFFSIVPALILPLWFLRRPGKLRRFFWCWLVPVAPLMFWWDGVVSCLRQWGEREWRAAASRLGVDVRSYFRGTFSYYLVLQSRSFDPGR
jgi:hypothetical protein